MGFNNSHGLRDNVLILSTIFEKYKKKGVFCAFIDFKGAFDSVDRTLLISKLKQKNIDRNILDLIMSMYSNVKASIKGSDKSFLENIGVKQGDPLGPRLFNIFIDDLPDWIFSDNNEIFDPIMLDGKIIKCLLYADDLVLFSSTAAGLQKQLDKLFSYCQKWKLIVHVEKTFCMYVKNSRMNAANMNSYTNIYYDIYKLKYVSSFKYVGITFSCNGLFHEYEDLLTQKSNNAIFACMSRVLRLGKSCPLFLKMLLFKAYVMPVMTFGSDVVVYTSKTIDHLNKMMLRYCRWSLGVHKTTNSSYTLRECGVRPLNNFLISMKVNYFLLLQSRPSSHLTSVAMNEISILKSLKLHKKWFLPIKEKLSKWNLLYVEGRVSP